MRRSKVRTGSSLASPDGGSEESPMTDGRLKMSTISGQAADTLLGQSVSVFADIEK